MNGIALDGETADRITALNLKEHAGYMRKSLEKFYNGEYLHPDDVVLDTRLLAAIDLLLEQYFMKV